MMLLLLLHLHPLQSPRTHHDRIYVLPLLTILTNKASVEGRPGCGWQGGLQRLFLGKTWIQSA